MTIRILNVSIKTELDVVGARQRARQIAKLCGFSSQDQVRIATSVSELGRNVYNYAGRGQIRFTIEGATAPQVLTINVEDQGPGIPNIEAILSGRYQSTTGMGKGLSGAQSLVDRFDIKTGPTIGTSITLQKIFPLDAELITPQRANQIFFELTFPDADSTLTEVLQQNQELLSTLAELQTRQEELTQLTRELEDTNRGMVALYAELDEKADHLRRADEMKSRFLSNTSHEFRTPLSSIRALAKLLLDRCDGELTVEQEKQVKFILESACNLTDLVNDLLDLAKIESGRIDLHLEQFNVSDIFSALRGMLRPLLISESLQLNFIEPETPLVLYTDEAKLSQILRNFISNALKFTEAGSITINAEVLPDTGLIRFNVADTGLGISPEDLELIFEEFGQVANPLQRRVKGTGLGLPLCRSLASLLKGQVSVESTPGVGSVFSVTIPQSMPEASDSEINNYVEVTAANDPRLPVLVVEDDPTVIALYVKYFEESDFRVVIARNLNEAADLWRMTNPVAIVLDICLNGKYTWSWLAEIKKHPKKETVPVIVASDIDDKQKGLSLGADAYFVKPLGKNQLLSALYQLTNKANDLLLQADRG